jgi:hypothetical protein
MSILSLGYCLSFFVAACCLVPFVANWIVFSRPKNQWAFSLGRPGWFSLWQFVLLFGLGAVSLIIGIILSLLSIIK